MDFFSKVSGTISNKSKDVAHKAKELAEIANLNGQVSTQESNINRYYKEIGELVYNERIGIGNSDLDEKYAQVDAAYDEIKHLKAKIRKVKGVKTCVECGAEISLDASFCPKCGKPVPAEDPEEVMADAVRDVTEAEEETVDAEATKEPAAEAVKEGSEDSQAPAEEKTEASAE